MRPEIVQRVVRMNTHFRNCRTRVYAQRALSFDARISLAETYCFTRLFHNAGTWDALRDADLARARSGYMSVLRVIAGMVIYPGTVRRTDEQVLVHLQQLPCEVRLLMLRIKFLIRFVQHAPPPLVRVTLLAATADRSWLQTICIDVEQLRQRDTALNAFLDGGSCDPASLLPRIHHDPRRARRVLLHACRYHPIEKKCVATNAESEFSLSCPDCDNAFPTLQQLLTHRAKRHGYINPMRARIDSSVCHCCNTDFITPGVYSSIYGVMA